MSRVHVKNLLFLMLTIVLSSGAIFGQTSGFNYQGRLTDGGAPANGNYDLQFALFDAVDGNNQIGQTKVVTSVPVSAGIFTVTLDFGANAFSGASRFMEISARPSGAGSFALLTPRQPITSTPYAVRSSSAAAADNAQQLAGFAANQYVKTDDARMSDARDPKSGNSNYVQNSISPQAASNFNVSGNGTVGGTLSGNTVNAATQYNLAGQKILEVSNLNILKIGNNAHVGIGPTFATGYQLDVESPDRFGLRVGTLAAGGTALSIGGVGSLEVDAPNNPAGRFVVKEAGNVGIGNPNPTSKLSVAGTIESGSGGFKFPDGSVQATAANVGAGKGFSAKVTTELEVAHSNFDNEIMTLTLPQGNYLINATINFENRANDLFQDNSRTVKCWFMENNISELMGTNHLGAPGSPMDFMTMTIHTTVAHFGNGAVAIRCGTSQSGGNLFAKDRRLTAVRLADN
jgi:hypothetical protein